jgi:hypothetical protein
MKLAETIYTPFLNLHFFPQRIAEISQITERKSYLQFRERGPIILV